MELAIKTQQISKIFTPSSGWRRRGERVSITAVDDITLAVDKGELFGLLGPNGAGKTTLVKMLCTLILPTHGTATVAGIDLHDERKIRAVSGLVVSDERSFFWRLSVQRNLEFFAAMYGFNSKNASFRAAAVLRDVDLLDRAGQRFSDLSSGMRQRLAIARALLHEPKVLFLDEPTRSLDPIATRHLHELILRVREERQMTILLITHDLAEAEKLCDRVALMHRAKIRKIGKPEELRRHLNPQRYYTVATSSISEANCQALQTLIPTIACSQPGENKPGSEVRFIASEEDDQLTAVIDFLRQNGIKIFAVTGGPPSLEDVFSYFTSDESEE